MKATLSRCVLELIKKTFETFGEDQDVGCNPYLPQNKECVMRHFYHLEVYFCAHGWLNGPRNLRM